MSFPLHPSLAALRRLLRHGVCVILTGALPPHAVAASSSDEHDTKAQASPSQSHEFELGLDYAAPPECPSGPEFLDRLSHHLQSSHLAPFPSSVEIEQSSGTYTLHLHVRLGGLTWKKTEVFSSCSDAIEVAAFDIAMARTQQRRLRDAIREQVMSNDPEMARASRRRPTSPGSLIANQDPQGMAAAETEAPPLEGSASDPADRVRSSTELDARYGAHQLSLRYQLRTGILPELAHGVSLEHRLPLGFLSVLSELSVWQPQVHAYGETGFPELSFRSGTLTVGPCTTTTVGTQWLSAWSCAIVSGYLLAVEARGPSGSSGSRLWASWGADLGAQAQLTSALALGVGVRVQSALSTPSVRIAPWDTLAYRASAAQLGAHVGLTFAFDPSSPPEAQ